MATEVLQLVTDLFTLSLFLIFLFFSVYNSDPIVCLENVIKHNCVGLSVSGIALLVQPFFTALDADAFEELLKLLMKEKKISTWPKRVWTEGSVRRQLGRIVNCRLVCRAIWFGTGWDKQI